MTLFSSIQQSSNALRVGQLGLQVVGNNISNANTPGYIRQQLIQTSGPSYRYGSSIISQGVVATGVQQQIDYFVADRLRDTQSQLSYQEMLADGLQEMQDALNEMGDNDISSALSRFSNSLQDVANNPQSNATRELAIRRGEELASAIKELNTKLDSMTQRTTQEVSQTANEINRLTESIAALNQRIVETEGGRTSGSDAVGLRDERIQRLNELAELVSFEAREQDNGTVTIIVGGDYLVADSISRDVYVAINDGDAARATEVRLKETDAPLTVKGGKLLGLYEQRDGVVATFRNELDNFSRSVINIVNRVHSQGQGAIGFKTVAGVTQIVGPNAPLEQAADGLDIDNGSFQVNVTDASTNTSRTYEINVRQLGDSSDTTAASIAQQLNDISGVTAAIGSDGRLRLSSDSEAIRFSFANDTSGALSALGINTFFQGTDASSMAVRPEIVSDPRLLAMSLDGVGSGARNALVLAQAFTEGQSLLGGLSVQETYETLVAKTAQHINSQQTTTEGLRNFRNTLEARHLGITGVNLDEEAAKMLMYQRAFQASSKVISVANDLLQTLVQMV